VKLDGGFRGVWPRCVVDALRQRARAGLDDEGGGEGPVLLEALRERRQGCLFPKHSDHVWGSLDDLDAREGGEGARESFIIATRGSIRVTSRMEPKHKALLKLIFRHNKKTPTIF
jgi:hypothetical protein